MRCRPPAARYSLLYTSAVPRFSRLRSSILEEFARQQRFAPARALRRQVERAERLLGEIDPASAYPEDWLVYRLTGYRAEIEAPALLTGEALLADLPALIERLSDGARYTAEELRDSSLSPDALARRWRISRRTLERYRRLGLAARRARTSRGRVCLRYMTAQAGVFERRRRDLFERPRAAPRVSGDERVRLHRAASKLRGIRGATLTAAAKLIARRHGRAVETIRRAVRRAEQNSTERTFPEQRRLDAAARQAVLQALNRGEPPRAIAARFGRSRASIHRLANERRAELLRRLDLTVSDAAAGMNQDELEQQLVTPAARVLDPRPAPLDIPSFVGEARRTRPPAAPVERHRAAALHALRALAARGIARLPRFDPPAALLDEIETMLRWASRLTIELVRSQSGLILRSIEERAGAAFEKLDPREAAELHRLAFDTAIAAASSFDPFGREAGEGGRLAAPTALELGRALARTTAASSSDESARRAAPFPARLADWTRRAAPWQQWLDPPAALIEAITQKGIPDSAREAVVARFGLDGSPPRTLAAVRRELGITEAGFARIVRRLLAAG